MNTKNKSKKSIGILLAAIMVTSVFVAFAPTAFSYKNPGDEDRNLSITNPQQHDCVRGTVNITLNETLYGITMWKVSINEQCNCFKEIIELECSGGCDHYDQWDTTEEFDDMCVERCIWVYNGTSFGASPFRANTGNFTIDNVNPNIDCISPIDGRWLDSEDIELNVSACDYCCGIDRIEANVSDIVDLTIPACKTIYPNGIATFDKQGTSYMMGVGASKCQGYYWTVTIPVGCTKTSCGIKNITAIVYDNAIDKDGNNNTASCDELYFGVDKDKPTKVEDVKCEESPGAIRIFWDDKEYDICSGVDHYKVYGTRDDGVSKVVAPDVPADPTGTAEFMFTGAGTPFADYCHNYTFNVTAVDRAGKEGPNSDNTSSQHLQQGPPAKIELKVPGELEGCGTKPDYENVHATVKDAYDVLIGDVEVCFNTTDGQICPTKEKTSKTGCSKGVASSFYTPPRIVLEPYNVTVCAWVCDDESIVECKPILITPKQATGATITADPTMIATDGSTSLITVQLVDRLGNPVAGSGNQDVTVTTTAGTFASTTTNTVSGKIAAGKFTTTLVSGDTPTLATVSANVGNLYFPETTVAFAGYGSYDIPLYKGWNLISLPLVPDNDDAGVVLEDIANELIEAWTYDGCDDEWTSGTFVPPVGWEGDLETMEVERGYWLEMNELATLTVTGYTMLPGNVPPPTYDVCEGWNLVGYYAIPPDKVMPADEYFTEVVVSYKVLGFDGEAQGWITVDESDNLYSGKGYWMNAESEEGEITPQEWV